MTKLGKYEILEEIGRVSYCGNSAYDNYPVT
jgi:hypothetical protein